MCMSGNMPVMFSFSMDLYNNDTGGTGRSSSVSSPSHQTPKCFSRSLYCSSDSSASRTGETIYWKPAEESRFSPFTPTSLRDGGGV